MKDLSSIASELSRGKNMEDNFDKYIKGISSMYNALGYIKLAMNYYTVYDMIRTAVMMKYMLTCIVNLMI